MAADESRPAGDEYTLHTNDLSADRPLPNSLACVGNIGIFLPLCSQKELVFGAPTVVFVLFPALLASNPIAF